MLSFPSMDFIAEQTKARRWDQIDVSQEAPTNPGLHRFMLTPGPLEITTILRRQGCSPLCSMCQSRASRVCRPRTWGTWRGSPSYPTEWSSCHVRNVFFLKYLSYMYRYTNCAYKLLCWSPHMSSISFHEIGEACDGYRQTLRCSSVARSLRCKSQEI